MISGAVADAALGARLLDSLEASQIPYAVLHGEEQLACGVLRSDVDLAVGIPITDVLASLKLAAQAAGAGLIMLSPYDEGGLATFWLRRDWSGGVQIDLLRDPDGRSKLAFKTDVALRNVERGERWMKLTPAAEHAYLLSKRWVKGDGEALELLRARAKTAPLWDTLTARRACALSAVGTTCTRSSRPRHAFPLLRSRLSRRGLRRMRYPIGLLIELTGDGDACAQVADVIRERLVSVVTQVEKTAGSSWSASLRRSVSLRRAHVFVSVGHAGQRPDIAVRVSEGVAQSQVLDQLWDEIVAVTEARTERQLRVHRFHY